MQERQDFPMERWDRPATACSPPIPRCLCGGAGAGGALRGGQEQKRNLPTCTSSPWIMRSVVDPLTVEVGTVQRAGRLRPNPPSSRRTSVCGGNGDVVRGTRGLGGGRWSLTAPPALRTKPRPRIWPPVTTDRAAGRHPVQQVAGLELERLGLESPGAGDGRHGRRGRGVPAGPRPVRARHHTRTKIRPLRFWADHSGCSTRPQAREFRYSFCPSSGF